MDREQLIDIFVKAMVAVAFFFTLQYVFLGASLETSVIWGLGMGGIAAAIAWSQWKRR